MTEIKQKPMKKDWRHLEFLVPIEESQREENGDFLIKGTAINVTTTRNGTKFIANELKKSAASLRNKPLLKDHVNSVDNIVGRTTENVNFSEALQGIPFEARVVDEDMKAKISSGLITSVSVGAVVEDLKEEIEDDEATGAFIATGIDFVELSLVAVPADPNAGFAKACMESFKLKEELKQEMEETTMSEEIKQDTAQPEVKEELKEEVVQEQKVESVQTVKVDLSEFKDVLTAQADKIKALEEELKAAQTIKEEAEVPVKEEAEAPAEDKTEGEVTKDAEEDAEADTTQEFLVTNSEFGSGKSICRENYNKQSRLNPNADYAWETK